MTPAEPSRLLEDLLGPDPVDTVDGAGSGEVPLVVEGVGGGAGALAPGRGHRGPGDVEPVSAEGADTFGDGAGDDPLHGVGTGGVGLVDDDGARVLDLDRVDPVDGVRADDALAVDDLGSADRTPGDQGCGAQRHDETNENQDRASHGADGNALVSPRRPGVPRWAKVVGGVVGVLLGAALAFAIIQPITVLPRIRVAPGYALVDQAGAAFTSETARGAVTLYSFAPFDCGVECDEIASTLREVRDRVPLEADLADVDFRIVTIALADEPAPAALAAAAEASGADGEQWRWIGGEWDRVRTVVGAGFRRYFERNDAGEVDFDPGYVIVDGNGVIRAQNRYATVADDADKLVRQVGTLGDEIRYAHGIAALGYEAAHLFLCYD